MRDLQVSCRRQSTKLTAYQCVSVRPYLALFLQCISQVAVGIRKVRLQLNGSPICVNGQLHQATHVPMSQYKFKQIKCIKRMKGQQEVLYKGQPDLPLLIVDTGQIPVDNGMVRTETKSSEISCHCTVKDSSFLQHIAKVDVGIQKCGVQLHSLHNNIN